MKLFGGHTAGKTELFFSKMKQEIRGDFGEILHDIGEELIVERTGALLFGIVAPMDISRAMELGGYVDKTAFEVVISAGPAGLEIGDRLFIQSKTYRIATSEKDPLAGTLKLSVMEI